MPPLGSEHGHEIAEVYVEANTDYAINTDLIQSWTGADLVVEVDVGDEAGERCYRYRSICAEMAAVLGRAESELIGRRIDEVLPPAVALRTTRRLDRVVGDGASGRVLQDADISGRRVSVETTSTLVRRSNGTLSVLTVMRDATDSVDSARSAVRGRGMLERVFAISPDMIALVGPSGTIQYANAAFARVLGFDPVTLVGTHLTKLLDAPSGVMLDDLAGMDSGDLVPARIRTSDGSWRDVDVTVSGTPDAGPPSEQAATVVVIRDMTAARRNGRSLARRRHQMAALAELGQLALTEHDLDTVLTAAVRSLAGGLEVPFALVARYDDDAERVKLLESIGMDAVGEPGATVELDDGGSLTWLLTNSDPLVVNDWSRETRCSQSMTTRALGVRSSVSVAIRTPAGIWGLLKGSDRQVRDFSEHDANFARSISHLVAAAVERRDFEAQLRRQAVHDPLTGLPNRSLLVDRLTHAFQRRDVGRVVLGFVDLDDFSAINNRCGHAVGDRVLAEAARRLAGQVRHGDIVARLGGDEFVVVCEDLDDDGEALSVARRILHELRRPIHVQGRTDSVTITASIGLATLDEAHQTPEHLIDAADEAMYAAKICGGDAIVGLGQTATPPAAARSQLSRSTMPGQLAAPGSVGPG